MINKRGIAPLVATLLLISFAVALGVMIMNFGRAQVELEAQCPVNIDLDFPENGKTLCYDSTAKKINFKVQNGVNIKIEGLMVSTVGSERADSFEIAAKISRAGIYEGNVNYDSTVNGEINQVKITPKIVLYDSEQVCTEKSLVVEKIEAC